MKPCTACTLSAPGVITSPNYPSKYPRNTVKTDTIQVDQGQAVIIDFTALDVHSSDFLKITDGDGTTLLANTAGSSLPDRVTSQSNVINILFTTNHNGEGTGWSASWHSAPPGQVSHTHLLFV